MTRFVHSSSKDLARLSNAEACLFFVMCQYNKNHKVSLWQPVEGSKNATSLTELSERAERVGFKSSLAKITFRHLRQLPMHAIIPLADGAFVVFMPSKLGRWSSTIRCIDPLAGPMKFTEKQFLERWGDGQTDSGEVVGAALLLEPTFKIYGQGEIKDSALSWGLVLKYLSLYRWQVAQVFATLLVTSLLQLSFPFLMQSIVDVGITTRDIGFIKIVLIAQLVLVVSRTIVDFIRNYLLMYVSSVISMSMLSAFWIKLTRLPMTYFHQHTTGDILQRINDNKQIQTFLTGSSIQTLFSTLNFIVFAVMLIFYDVRLFLVFFAGVILYVIWIWLFLGIRRKLNKQIFWASSRENDAALQIVNGMQEIKLQGVEQVKRWEWENAQQEIFRFNFRNLTYGQVQQGGSVIIRQGTDFILTFMVAGLVINGQLTFGAMLAIQFILGQLSGPIEHFIGFIQVAQDAKISMERLNEIHRIEDEDGAGDGDSRTPSRKNIRVRDLSFAYPGVDKHVLDNLSFEIEEGKTTAIVGLSGSGKTTLIKLLVKFYDNYQGDIKIGDVDLKQLSPALWRKQCGVIFQDGYIFNGTIASNIAPQEGKIDYKRLLDACRMANILSFVESLPDGFSTRLGIGGIGISSGQKQRILIARTVYRNPDFLFFDEATNALDANNEKAIVENMKLFFKDKTVVVIAHRLSTVRNADKIIVIDNGTIEEQGTHEELSRARGRYYQLVKNQLELGN